MTEKLQILDATHRKSVGLIVVVAIDTAVIVIEVAIPRIARIVLGRRPEVGVVRAIVEIASIPIAGWRKNNRWIPRAV